MLDRLSTWILVLGALRNPNTGWGILKLLDTSIRYVEILEYWYSVYRDAQILVFSTLGRSNTGIQCTGMLKYWYSLY